MPPIKSNKETTEADTYIGARVRALRMAKGLSQTGLAEHLGVTFQQVQKYERGKNRISAGRLMTIAGVLNAPISSILPKGNGVNVNATAINDPCHQLSQTHRGTELAQAFNQISNRGMRDTIVAMVEAVAALTKKGAPKGA